MNYGFEIKPSDRPDYHWLIFKREEKTDGFCLKLSDINRLKAMIVDYIDTLEPIQIEAEQD